MKRRSRRKDNGFNLLYESLFDDPRPQIERLVRLVLKNKHNFKWIVPEASEAESLYGCYRNHYTVITQGIFELTIYKRHPGPVFSMAEVHEGVKLHINNKHIQLTQREYSLFERAMSDITLLPT